MEGPDSDEKSPESIEERFAGAAFNPFSRLYHSNKDPKAEERLKRELAQQQERQRIQRLKEINKNNQ